jgi:hypothetical protein
MLSLIMLSFGYRNQIYPVCSALNHSFMCSSLAYSYRLVNVIISSSLKAITLSCFHCITTKNERKFQCSSTFSFQDVTFKQYARDKHQLCLVLRELFTSFLLFTESLTAWLAEKSHSAILVLLTSRVMPSYRKYSM